MNLEVVRSRAARGGAELSAISRFAESAAGELERAAELVQALLELARPLPVPVDLWSALRPMVVLHRALATAGAAGATMGGDAGKDGPVPASLTLEPCGESAPAVATDPATARAALALALDAAAGAGGPVRVSCSVEAREAGYVVVILRCEGPAAPLEDSVRGTLEDGGVRLETVPNGLTLFFRAAARE